MQSPASSPVVVTESPRHRGPGETAEARRLQGPGADRAAAHACATGAAVVDAFVHEQRKRERRRATALDDSTTRLLQDLRRLPKRVEEALTDLDEREAAIGDARAEIAKQLRRAADVIAAPAADPS